MVELCRRSSLRNASTTTEARLVLTARPTPGRFDSRGSAIGHHQARSPSTFARRLFPHLVNTARRFVDEMGQAPATFVDKAVVASWSPGYVSSCPKGPTQTDRRGAGQPEQRRRSGRTSRKARPHRDRRSGGWPAEITSRLVASTIEPVWQSVPSGVSVPAGRSQTAGIDCRGYTPAMGGRPIR
jgi:hypothetical protein